MSNDKSRRHSGRRRARPGGPDVAKRPASRAPDDVAGPDESSNRDTIDDRRRALLRVGWTVPVVLAAAPKAYAAGLSTHADHGDYTDHTDRNWHDDFTHLDHTDQQHLDTPHGDHQDGSTHLDMPHQDSHIDYIHGDQGHGDHLDHQDHTDHTDHA